MGKAFVLLRGPDIEKSQGGFDKQIYCLANSNASFKTQLIWLTPYARIFLRLLASCLAFSSPSPMTCVPPLFKHRSPILQFPTAFRIKSKVLSLAFKAF